MSTKTLVLIIASILLAIGIFKPDLSSLGIHNNVVVVDTEHLNLDPPSENLLPYAKDVIKALSTSKDRKVDGVRLAKLYNDMATLIELNGENEAIKTTEEIRQANRLTGLMLQLDIKNKYTDLAEAAQVLIVEAIGDDNVLLNNELRAKAVDGFKALAWGCNEGAK